MNKPLLHTESYIAQLKRIERQINGNRLQEAALQLNLLAKGNAHDPRLFLLGLRLAEAAHNPDGMLVAARKANQLAPQWPTATIHLAAVLASRNEVDEAMAMAELAVEQASMQANPVDIDIELLVRAAAVAQRLNLHQPALQWLRQAERLNPADSGVRFQIAVTLTNSGDYEGAIELLTDLLQQQPNNAILLSARLRAYLSAKRAAEAVRDGEALVAMQPSDEVSQFYLDIARGNTPRTQPAAVITGLFDGYAENFDHNLVVQLQYKLPRDVAQMIHQWHPDHKADILDLGCGTGLLGACLGPIDGALIGVDLSKEMVDKASVHHVYDRFHLVNILDALEATPADHYNVIVALDVLIYVGDLGRVIPNAYRILMSAGRFVFSCETGVDEGADYALQGTLRYTHNARYVQRLLQAAGFEEIDVQHRVLRQDAGEPVPGFLVVARKPLKVVRKSAPRSPKSAKPVRPAQ